MLKQSNSNTTKWGWSVMICVRIMLYLRVFFRIIALSPRLNMFEAGWMLSLYCNLPLPRISGQYIVYFWDQIHVRPNRALLHDRASKGIEIICSSRGNFVGIDDSDLCILLGNMLDNAIDSCICSEHGYIGITFKVCRCMITATKLA